jgi:GlpG protein
MFNVYWLWILGGALERHIGSGKYLVFFLSAAIVSSGMQLGFAGNTGIGLSGVVYAIFGFLWWYRKATPEFISLLNPRTVQLFLGWLVVCIVLTVLKIWQVGNAAHVAGLLFGVTTAASFDQARRRSGFRLASAGLLAGSLAPLFWCPWSVHWIAHRAYDAHVRGDLDAAIRGYERSLAMGLSDREWALQNLAIAYRGRGDEGHFGSTMKQLRRINAAAAQEVETRMKNDAATKSTGH